MLRNTWWMCKLIWKTTNWEVRSGKRHLVVSKNQIYITFFVIYIYIIICPPLNIITKILVVMRLEKEWPDDYVSHRIIIFTTGNLSGQWAPAIWSAWSIVCSQFREPGVEPHHAPLSKQWYCWGKQKKMGIYLSLCIKRRTVALIPYMKVKSCATQFQIYG